jgi:hypothetical protein
LLTLHFSEDVRTIDVDGEVEDERDGDEDRGRLVVSPVLHQGVDDGSFEDDVGGLRELKRLGHARVSRYHLITIQS